MQGSRCLSVAAAHLRLTVVRWSLQDRRAVSDCIQGTGHTTCSNTSNNLQCGTNVQHLHGGEGDALRTGEGGAAVRGRDRIVAHVVARHQWARRRGGYAKSRIDVSTSRQRPDGLMQSQTGVLSNNFDVLNPRGIAFSPTIETLQLCCPAGLLRTPAYDDTGAPSTHPLTPASPPAPRLRLSEACDG